MYHLLTKRLFKQTSVIFLSTQSLDDDSIWLNLNSDVHNKHANIFSCKNLQTATLGFFLLTWFITGQDKDREAISWMKHFNSSSIEISCETLVVALDESELWGKYIYHSSQHNTCWWPCTIKSYNFTEYHGDNVLVPDLYRTSVALANSLAHSRSIFAWACQLAQNEEITALELYWLLLSGLLLRR